MTPPVRFLHARVAGGPLYLRARTAARAVFCVGVELAPHYTGKTRSAIWKGWGGGGCHMLGRQWIFYLQIPMSPNGESKSRE